MKNKGLLRWTAALSLVALGFLFSGSLAQAKSDEDSKKGIAAAKAGKWDEAIENFLKAAKDDPGNKRVQYNLGLAYRQRGFAQIKKEKWQGAINDLGEALKRREDDPAAYRFRAFAYLRLRKWKEALSDYDVIVKEKSKDTEAIGRRAFVEVQLKKYDKALTDYTAALKLAPKDSDMMLARSYVYETTDKFDKALADAQAALKIKPSNTDALAAKKRLEAIIARGGSREPTPDPGTPIPRKAVPSVVPKVLPTARPR